MMRKFLYIICFFLIGATCVPVYAGDTRQKSPPPEISEKDMEIVKVMEILKLMDMMENLDLLEDVDLLVEEEDNEKND